MTGSGDGGVKQGALLLGAFLIPKRSWPEQQDVIRLAALGLVHGQGQGRFQCFQSCGVQQPWTCGPGGIDASEEHAPLRACPDREAPITIGKPKLWLVGGTEHRNPWGPGLDTSFGKQGPMQHVDPPGAHPARAEHLQSVQLIEGLIGGGCIQDVVHGLCRSGGESSHGVLKRVQVVSQGLGHRRGDGASIPLLPLQILARP